MTLEEIEAKMVELKFRFQPVGSGDSLVGHFFRPCETTRTMVKDAPDVFEVQLHDRYRITRIDEVERYAFEASIRGEFMPKRWASIVAYSIRPEEFFEQHRSIETALVRAWEAMKPEGPACSYCSKPMTDPNPCKLNPFSDFHVGGT